MSLHKLTAGSGYDYLTRQVAALDATDKGHIGLASYYTERGRDPGVWVGSGLAGIDGLERRRPGHRGADAGPVRLRAAPAGGAAPAAAGRAGPDRGRRQGGRLGSGSRSRSTTTATAFQVEVAKRIADHARRWALRATAGRRRPSGPGSAPRWRREFFRAEHGRDPVDARELAGHDRQGLSRPQDDGGGRLRPDLLPGEVVSAPCGRSPHPQVAAAIERAHQAAVADALRFIEKHALFTRDGHATGSGRSTSAAWSRPRSPTATPAPATPTCTPTSRSRTRSRPSTGGGSRIDGRVLFKANVAASETYNTALEKHLRDTLGVRFAERPGTDPAKRPVREIVGVDPRLNQRWSTRRAAHRGPPRRAGQPRSRPTTAARRPPVEAIHLAQQATLETRDAKHEPRIPGRAARHLAREAARGPRRPRGGRGHGRTPPSPPAAAGHHGRPMRRGCATTADQVADRPGGNAGRPGRSGTSAPRPSARSAPRPARRSDVETRRRPGRRRGPRAPLGAP